MSSHAFADSARASRPALALARAPLAVAVADHQGKSAELVRAIAAAGNRLVDDPGAADVVLIDHDVPFHGKLHGVEACVAAGGRAFLYPHGATSTLMTGWDGLYPVSPLLSGALVTAAGHAEVCRRFGYPHPVFPIGWSLCELREKRQPAAVEHVLFAPEHDPPDPSLNASLFERLLATPAKLTVRHLGPLEQNGLWRVDGVEYVQGSIVDLHGMLAQIDAADAVVAVGGTFLSLAVARGVPAVNWGRDRFLLDSDNARKTHHSDAYADYVRFPFLAEDGDLWETICAAAADRERVSEWRRRFVGEPLDDGALEAALRCERAAAAYWPEERTPRPTRLHAGALAALEHERPLNADALLVRALSESTDLELLNDLAVVRSLHGDAAGAEALLRTALLLDPTREDARENLAALVPATGTAPSPAAASWRASGTLGGPDPDMPERAFPGMKAASAPLMAEHSVRYAHAMGAVGGLHVLDLGCGTGYGSEMLTWTAASVRGFDLWQPGEDERPHWPGGAVLTYGHDLCADPLPQADLAVCFEVLEHLADAPAALRLMWASVGRLIVSFPNPVFHGSHHNRYHVNDWPLERVEQELISTGMKRFARIELQHLVQTEGGLVVPGRDPKGYYWILSARGIGPLF